jgi:hypothetical protein
MRRASFILAPLTALAAPYGLTVLYFRQQSTSTKNNAQEARSRLLEASVCCERGAVVPAKTVRGYASQHDFTETQFATAMWRCHGPDLQLAEIEDMVERMRQSCLTGGRHSNKDEVVKRVEVWMRASEWFAPHTESIVEGVRGRLRESANDAATVADALEGALFREATLG